MKKSQKQAYRFLLYWGYVEIRPIQWSFTGLIFLFRPVSTIRYIQQNGALADWLHNLALYSTLDFEGFDEDRFWEDGVYFGKKHPETYERYKLLYEQELAKDGGGSV